MKKLVIDKDKLGLLYFVLILTLLIIVLGLFELNVSNIFLNSTTKTLTEKCEFNANTINSRILEEIGDQLGLTRERVRQIREKSIAKLRDSGNARILLKYLG